MGLELQVALLHGSRTDRYLLFHANGTMGACLGQMGLYAKHDCCAGPECWSLAFSAINAAGSPDDLDRGSNFAAFRRAADQRVSFLGAAFAVTKTST